MVRVFVFLTAVQVFLVVLALISCLSAERVRAMPRAVWVLTILFIPLLGPAAYFVAGRPVTGGRRSGLSGSRPRAASPDDDPDFLRSLNAEQARRDREQLAQWERELHNKDEKPPSKDGDVRPRDNEETPPTEV